MRKSNSEMNNSSATIDKQVQTGLSIILVWHKIVAEKNNARAKTSAGPTGV